MCLTYNHVVKIGNNVPFVAPNNDVISNGFITKGGTIPKSSPFQNQIIVNESTHVAQQ